MNLKTEVGCWFLTDILQKEGDGKAVLREAASQIDIAYNMDDRSEALERQRVKACVRGFEALGRAADEYKKIPPGYLPDAWKLPNGIGLADGYEAVERKFVDIKHMAKQIGVPNFSSLTKSELNTKVGEDEERIARMAIEQIILKKANL